MQHDASGPVPPLIQKVPALPMPPRRRKPSPPDRRWATVHKAVLEKGAAYGPDALAEETGLPVDAIRRFAAVIISTPRPVSDDEGVVKTFTMVELGMIDHEDATRMGSEALAASFRILGARHDSIEPKNPPTRYYTAADLMGMRRVAARFAKMKRLVTAPRTLCSRCGARADAQGGCTHQQLMRADQTTNQGLPPHA